MTVCVALFRGINVGGHNKLPMQELREILNSLGCENVRTYIQSGNAVFRTTRDPSILASEIEISIEDRFGFKPGVLILGIDEFRAIAAGNPYTSAETDPARVHLSFFVETPVEPDLDELERLKAPTESFEFTGEAFYLLAPEGIGRSKLAAKVEKALGVEATGRNWRTVMKILELADSTIS